MDFEYKKYSLEQLENWMHDALSCSEATPQEIYDVIKSVVSENYHIYKNHTERCYELLSLLNGSVGNDLSEILKEREYYEGWDPQKKSLVCDKDDPSEECKKSWNDFWEENYYPEEHKQYTEEELNAMCDKAASDEEKNKCREYNLREAEYYDKRAKLDAQQNKVKKWVLPVEETKIAETDETDYFVTFPDDLLEAANLKEGDQIEWIDQGDGSYLLKKVNHSPLNNNDDLFNFRSYDDMIAEGWSMTADGFWIKEN